MTYPEKIEKQDQRKIEKRISNITKSLQSLQSSLNILTIELKNSPDLGTIDIPRGKPPSLSNLITAKEMSEKLNNLVSEERLIELAESKLIPHYELDNHIMFAISETREWIDYNCVIHHPGQQIEECLATVINVVSPSIDKIEVPIELRAISAFLIPLSLQSVETVPFAGVYFLCSKGKVVYTGCSGKCAFNRIGQHFGRKTFDFAFFLRVPPSDLFFVEKEFINILKPKYNWDKTGDHLIVPTPSITPPKKESLMIVETMRNA